MENTTRNRAQASRPFDMDVTAIRAKARQDIESGAVTGTDRADRKTVLKLLNEALGTEIVYVLRYKRHFFMARGLNAEPNLSPKGLLERSYSEYIEGATFKEMIKENLIAERIAIDSYRQMIDYIGEQDSTTRRLLEESLAVEEEHADAMSDFLAKH